MKNENASCQEACLLALCPDAGRARSASEAFIFRRFESLPELKGRFRLNQVLPIPFDDRGQTEVDLLCQEAKIVIEIDGSQHLGDAAAYRRDRRKDALLQADGYFVLRFLAEDLARHLNEVLDAVLRVMAMRMRTQGCCDWRSSECGGGQSSLPG